jgi:hypothetical protein
LTHAYEILKTCAEGQSRLNGSGTRRMLHTGEHGRRLPFVIQVRRQESMADRTFA